MTGYCGCSRLVLCRVGFDQMLDLVVVNVIWRFLVSNEPCSLPTRKAYMSPTVVLTFAEACHRISCLRSLLPRKAKRIRTGQLTEDVGISAVKRWCNRPGRRRCRKGAAQESFADKLSWYDDKMKKTSSVEMSDHKSIGYKEWISFPSMGYESPPIMCILTKNGFVCTESKTLTI